ncbi:hypothetical protein, partial [Klebsiella pneumoniae]|uniref:hypothetical protein n=1 Tax=Klebsiella pneumoniae TaxID=573 RepID=UPI003D35DFC9
MAGWVTDCPIITSWFPWKKSSLGKPQPAEFPGRKKSLYSHGLLIFELLFCVPLEKVISRKTSVWGKPQPEEILSHMKADHSCPLPNNEARLLNFGFPPRTAVVG